MNSPRVVLAACACMLLGLEAAVAQEISYRVTVPEPEHHWAQVEAVFTGVHSLLELRMSRSSPGRYALHEFAKNVYDVRAFEADGREIAVTRPDPYGWNVKTTGTTVRVTYRVFGDQVDGTYLAIDTTHAHMNMPATFMWARGMLDRPIRISFVAPAGADWKLATQLLQTPDSTTFTAPNLQYFMDSPTEFGPVWEYSFTAPAHAAEPARFRIALHHDASEAEAKTYAAGVEKIVREEQAVFGEYPEYEPGRYTFIADFLPYAHGDGMEHRNSTVMTGRRSLSTERGMAGALETVAHEFFHSWNVERIRPATLEPFDFERANMSGELWLAEGFTNYYGTLVMQRTGLVDLGDTLTNLGSTVNWVVNHPGTRVRTAVEMSQMAPFVDAAEWTDPTNFEITFLSYYTFGEGLALALDLSLRDLTNGRVTLDDYMRAMWRAHGKPGGLAPGLVAHPYTLSDARARLAEVSGDARFADDFFSRYIEGHETPDYARLLQRAGLVLKRRNPGAAWMGDLQLQSDPDGVRLTSLSAPGTPAYAAGLDMDDVIAKLGDRAIHAPDELAAVLGRSKPGDALTVAYVRRGKVATTKVTLAENPALEIVAAESAGGPLTPAQRQFRDAWLSSRVSR
jgi:predicted metalloprotease with PDZ domain